MKNYYRILFLFKENNFIIQYYINEFNTISMNTLNTLFLSTPSRSISFDLKFNDSISLYGLPIRMSEMSLKPTDKDSGYRLFNLDCANHVPGDLQSLYGSIPIVHSLNTNKTISSILYDNPSDTWIDLSFNDHNNDKSLKFVSQGGIVNLYMYSDTDYNRIFYKQSLITGFSKLHPLFSLGYHQCRWSYMNQGEVEELIDNFENHEIPFDVIWLDIDHTDKKKYFTWDKIAFHKPEEFIDKLAKNNRKLVTIIDPHISIDKNYIVSKELMNQDCLVKKSNNEVFIGNCWPGDSYYADFINPAITKIWKNFFMNEDYFLKRSNIHTWIDMNEPSVFNYRENTMPKDNNHFDGEMIVPHFEIHNIYGYSYHKVTYCALKNRFEELNLNLRPFVLSRSFYAGSQKWGFIWTGDNNATFPSLKYSIDQLLTINLCGYSACGADVGGFFGDPDEKLAKAWYQVNHFNYKYGAFNPFFRGHAHEATKRREPWCFSKETTDSIRESILMRYKLILFWYTCFFENSISGLPVLSPFWIRFSKWSKEYCNYSDSFVVGNKIVVYPFCNKKRIIDLPCDEVFYDFRNGELIKNKIIEDKNENVLIFVIGGSIIPLIPNPNYYTIRENISLEIYPDNQMTAMGTIYIDDGETFKNENGELAYLEMLFKKDELTIKHLHNINKCSDDFPFDKIIEIINIYGLNYQNPHSISIMINNIKNYESYELNGNRLIIKNLKLSIKEEHSIKIKVN